MPEQSHVRNVAIVGCGNTADGLDEDQSKRHICFHATAISKLKQLNITACCDIDPARMERLADIWGIGGRDTDYQKMVDDEMSIAVDKVKRDFAPFNDGRSWNRIADEVYDELSMFK